MASQQRSSCWDGWRSAFRTRRRNIARAGHEIASHGYAHRLVYATSPEEFRDGSAARASGDRGRRRRAVVGYRAPSFSITRKSLWALDVLIEEGYAYDSSIYPDSPRSIWHS